MMNTDSRSAAKPFTIRRATPHDAPAILACLATAFAPYREQYSPEAFADTILTPQSIQLRLGEMCVFVAVATGDVVGTIGCKVSDDEGHLRGMAVLPTWQGSGIASALLNAAEDYLRDIGCRRVTLDTTRPLQRAIRYYENHGYSASGTIRDFFGMPLFEYVKFV